MTGTFLHSVVAHDEAGPKRTARGGLGGVTLAIEAGVTAVLGTPEDGALALFEVLSGVRKPRRGAVRVEGQDPSRSAAVRARIGSLGLEPSLAEARTVADSVSIAASAWSRPVSTSDVLGPHGLAKLASRPLASITFAEARAVERALALAVPDPLLLVLYEPFFDDGEGGAVAARIQEIGARVPVIVLTSSLRDARAAKDALVLTRGAFVHRGPASDVGPGGAAELVIEVVRGARGLAARLSQSRAVRAVALEARGEEADAAGSLRVSGADSREVARAVADATRETGAEITMLSESLAELADVRNLSEWRGRIADAAARQAAALRSQMGTWRPVGPAPPGPAPTAPSAQPPAPAPEPPPVEPAAAPEPPPPSSPPSADAPKSEPPK